MIPAFPQFTPLSFEVAEEYQALLMPYPPYADFHLTNRIAWNLDNSAAVSLLYNNLVLCLPNYITGGGRLTVLGSARIPETIPCLIEYTRLRWGTARLELVPESVLKHLTSKSEWEQTEDVDNHDHIISIPKLATMTTSDLRHFRRAVRTFYRDYSSALVHTIDLSCPLTQNLIFNIFKKRENAKINNDAQHELQALARFFALTPATQAVGYGLTINGNLEAFIICESMAEQWAIGHFWKANTSIVGIYSFFMHRVAIHLQEAGYIYLNTQQDLGIDGLRRFKHSLAPIMHLKKYTLTPVVSSLQKEATP